MTYRTTYARVSALYPLSLFWDKRIQCQTNRLANALLRQTANRADRIIGRQTALASADRQTDLVAHLASVRHRRKRWPVARGIS